MMSIISILFLFIGFKFLPSKSGKQVIELDKRTYLLIYFTIYLSWILFSIVLSYFISITSTLVNKENSADFLFSLYPNNATNTGLSIVFGISISLSLSLTLADLLWKNKIYSFWEKYNLSYFGIGKYLLNFLLIALTILSVGLIELNRNLRFEVYEDKIKARKIFDKKITEYSFSEVEKIKFSDFFIAPNGDKKKVIVYKIKFKDGKEYSNDLFFRYPNEKDHEYFEKISLLSNVKITR